MHGMILRSIQCFVRDTYGQSIWHQIMAQADAGTDDFEPLKVYPAGIEQRVFGAASDLLDKPQQEILEDLGTYLVAHPNCAKVRRLLRFGGDTFLQFLHSLNELPDRAKLAVADLDLPALDLREHFAGALTLTVVGGPVGSGHVLVGLLRAMADDFGTLVMLDHVGRNMAAETLEIQMLEIDYSEGRAFQFAEKEAV